MKVSKWIKKREVTTIWIPNLIRISSSKDYRFRFQGGWNSRNKEIRKRLFEIFNIFWEKKQKISIITSVEKISVIAAESRKTKRHGCMHKTSTKLESPTLIHPMVVLTSYAEEIRNLYLRILHISTPLKPKYKLVGCTIYIISSMTSTLAAFDEWQLI